jgi:tetratricopeptide (TPR) repeat protein
MNPDEKKKKEEAEKKDAGEVKNANQFEDENLMSQISRLDQKAQELMAALSYKEAEGVLITMLEAICRRRNGIGKLSDVVSGMCDLAICEYGMGNYERAANIADTVISTSMYDSDDRQMCDLWFYKGVCAQSQGKCVEAHMFFTSAIRRMGKTKRYRHLNWRKALLCHHMGLYEEALVDYRAARALYLELGMEDDVRACDEEIDKCILLITPVPVPAPAVDT